MIAHFRLHVLELKSRTIFLFKLISMCQCLDFELPLFCPPLSKILSAL